MAAELVLECPVAVTATDERNTLAAPLQAIAAVPVEDARFEFDSSFLLPDATRALERVAPLHESHEGAPITVFGHADRAGSEDYNKTLSGRRARAVYAALVRNTDIWEDLYQNPVGGDNWQGRPVQYMLLTVGHDPGPIDGIIGSKTRKAIKDFQTANGLPATGNLNPTTRQALFAAYMDAICLGPDGQPFKLEASDFLGQGQDPDGKADYQGCSEFNPLLVPSKKQDKSFSSPKNKNKRDCTYAPNRRVTLFFIDPSCDVTPEGWPCPRAKEGPAGCRVRFWSDGEQRLTPGDDQRKQDETHDTYACRFYERLALTAVQAEGGDVAPGEVRVRWSKPLIRPIHNTSFPPEAAPFDAIPDDCKVEILVDTRGVPDGTPASIEVVHAQTGDVVSAGAFEGLEVRGDQVVVPETGARPEWQVVAQVDPWRVWDKPLFYLRAKVGDDQQGESPHNLDNEEDLLRVGPILVNICDTTADIAAGGTLSTESEMYMVADLQKLDPTRGVYCAPFRWPTSQISLWGSVIRNSYGYYQTSHGDVRCRIDGDQFDSSPDDRPTRCPHNASHPGRSVIFLGETPIGDAEAADQAQVPSVPRYLVFLNTCVAGWEPSFANTFIARGTRHVIAFKKYVPEDQAREMTVQFYRRWAQVYRCDPDKIPEVFHAVSPPFVRALDPVLYGAPPAPGVAAADVGSALGLTG